LSGSVGAVVHVGTFFVAVSASPASSGVAICQPWFYRRLAPQRGTIALLGCPRGPKATRPRTSFLTDIGGSLELHPSKRTTVFLEVGSPLIMFGERTKPLGNGAVAIAPGTVEGGLQISTGLRLRLGEVAREPSGATPQVRRYELGLLFSSLSLQRFFDPLKHEPGIGVRGSYSLTNHLSLDTEVDYFPRNPHAVSPQEGGKMLLAVFGARVGVRKRRAGFFAKARPGFLRYSQTLSDNSAILNPRYSPLSHFVLDAGGVFEVYPSQRTLVRFDVGDTIIWYGQRNVPGFLSPFPAFTRDTLQLSAGFAFRF
jgi:hypothetical protein